MNVERISKKLLKCQLDVKFLISCRDENVNPKFSRWKNLKPLGTKLRNRFYRRILLDEIDTKSKLLKKLREQKSC